MNIKLTEYEKNLLIIEKKNLRTIIEKFEKDLRIQTLLKNESEMQFYTNLVNRLHLEIKLINDIMYNQI